MADITAVPDTSEFDISLPTITDLSAKQYHFVKIDTNEQVVICGANDKNAGILQNAPLGTSTSKKIAIVRTGGLSKLKIAETVAFGKFLTPTADGDGEVCDAAGEEYGAKALTSGEDNDLIAVIVCHGEVEATDA